MGTGITLGVFVFLLTGAFLGQLVLHNNEAGFLPGLIAGGWVAWPFLHQARVQRYNFLHPVPREYKVPLKEAFAKVRDLLADTSYNFGDKWHIASADTTSGRITADLRFTDEQIHYDMDQRGQIHTRRERGFKDISLSKLRYVIPDAIPPSSAWTSHPKWKVLNFKPATQS